MVDSEGRPIPYSRHSSTGVHNKHNPTATEIPISVRNLRSGEHVILTSPRALGVSSPRANQILGITSPRALEVTSPRARDNAVIVAHGSHHNIEDGSSHKSSQTPVEFAHGTNNSVYGTNNSGYGENVTSFSRAQGATAGVHDHDNYVNSINSEINVDHRRQSNTAREINVQTDRPLTPGNAITEHSDIREEHTARYGETHNGSRLPQNDINAVNTDRQIERQTASSNETTVNEQRHSTSLQIEDALQLRTRELELRAGRNLERQNHTSNTTQGDIRLERRSSHGQDRSDVTTERLRSRRTSVGSRSVSSSRTRLRSARTVSTEEEEKEERYVVPALPMPFAIVCCVLNFVIPGSGSMLASLGVLCCAKTEDMNFKEKCGSCCTVFGIGLLQLLLVACFLIGWIWSCIWGITFIGMSKNYYNDDEELDPNLPAWERNLIGRTPLPEPQIVENQPYPGIGYDDLRRAYEHRRRQRQEQQQQRHNQRRSRSRLSDFIYPMRAPSNMAYHSPPPPYDENTDQPNQRSLDGLAADMEERRRHGLSERDGDVRRYENIRRDDRGSIPERNLTEAFRPMNSIIQEEDHIT